MVNRNKLSYQSEEEIDKPDPTFATTDDLILLYSFELVCFLEQVSYLTMSE